MLRPGSSGFPHTVIQPMPRAVDIYGISTLHARLSQWVIVESPASFSWQSPQLGLASLLPQSHVIHV
eukprot:6484032-Amphidinium_carterae.1